jgi:hypothetical protein
VINVGTGSVIWDCKYRSVEECVPNVLAGNRGFCNPSPSDRNEQKATALDVRSRVEGKYLIKLKTEALLLKDEVGGYRILYSHNCQFVELKAHYL